jgi:hypothetical protein
LRWRLIQ